MIFITFFLVRLATCNIIIGPIVAEIKCISEE